MDSTATTTNGPYKSTTTTTTAAANNANNNKRRRNDFSQSFGWSRNCSPSYLQCFANKHAFLIIFSLTCILQGTFRTYFVAVITTIEKLFQLPSQTTGLLLSATEIGQVSSSLLLPYYAGNGHRPRWMGVGSGLFSLAVLLAASPHWIIPPKLEYDSSMVNFTVNHGLCSNETNYGCEDGEAASVGGNYLIFGILFLSLLSVGLGQTAVNLLGIPYLDDNVQNKDSPVYFAITIGVRILGPVAGFILGALCTKLYIYPLQTPPYSPHHPRWLGAWWLGMLIIGSLLLLASILLFAFPAQLSSTKNNRVAKPVEKPPKLKHFPRTLKRLLSNKILCLRTLSSVFHLLPIAGLYTFLPKYLENQYRMPAHEANLYTGIAGILVMGIGIFSSGFIIRVYGRFFGGKGIAAWIGAAAGVYAIGMGLLVFVGGCDEGVIGNDGGGGGDLGFLESSTELPLLNLTAPLNISDHSNLSAPSCLTPSCSYCSPTHYSPICSTATKATYFSPCHAGCTETLHLEHNNELVFDNCSCIQHSIQTATPQPCRPDCNRNFIIYLTIFMAIVLVHSTSEVGSMLLTLRCVEKRDKAMALGLVQFAIGLLGNVPCPIVYGAVIDASCVTWGGCSAADGHGNCWVYDSVAFRRYFHGLTALLMAIAFVIDIFVYFHADQIKLEEDEPVPAGPPAAVELQPLNQ